MSPTRRRQMARCGALLALAAAACGERTDRNAGADPADPAGLLAAETITAADISRRIGVIAHDSMRGRRTPSPELDRVAAWAATEFAAMGLDPAFGTDWIQTYTVRTETPPPAATATLAGHPLEVGVDLGFPFGPQAEGTIDAPLVVLSGSAGWERRLQGSDLEGAAVVLVGERSEPGPRSREALRMFDAVRAAGAAAVLFASDLSDSEWSDAVALQLESPVTRPQGSQGGPPVLSVRDGVLRDRLAEAGVDLDGLRQRAQGRLEMTALPGARFTIDIRNRVLASHPAPNVAAVLEGADSAGATEYIVLSAHMDHVGVGRPDASGDSIYNGADDDASGTAAVLEIAEAFAALDSPPDRSVIFLLVSGEERGLWGSAHFAANPPVDLESVVANLNLDMVGRNWDDTIVVIGKDQSDLGETLERVNDRHPELGMTAIDDLWPEERFYFRSDHYNFARRGVPILFFFNGTHQDYHRPSDEPDLIDADKTARIGRLVFHLAVEVANGADRPRWDPKSLADVTGN